MNEENKQPAHENEPRPADAPARQERLSSGPAKYILICAVVAVVAFLIGFVPMWMRANDAENDRENAKTALRLLRIENALAAAVIDARRGNYEPARQSASTFFTSLRTEADRGSDSVLTPQQRDTVTPLFEQRDHLITLLARSDPASADRLSDLYVTYRDITDGTVPPQDPAPSTNTAAGAPPK